MGPSTTIFDDLGDLTLIVGPDEVKAQVCSRALARHSPFFKCILYGPFSESRPLSGADWVVRLPEDQWSSTHIMLSSTHGKFDLVPKAPSLDSIYELLVLADKYDMIKTLCPFIRAWKPWVLEQLLEYGRHGNMCRAIGIAWELGAERILKDLAGRWQWTVVVEGDLNLVTIEELQAPLIPPGLLEAFLGVRATLLASIHDQLAMIIKNPYQLLFPGGGDSNVETYCRYGLLGCHKRTLDHLWSTLVNHGLQTFPMGETVNSGSKVSSISRIIKVLKQRDRDLRCWARRDLYGNNPCNPVNRLVRDIEYQIDGLPSPVTEGMRNRMARRKDMLGISW
ncbi:hypothetical protein V8F06_011884 [Rhypophila decipiens]